MPIGHEIKQQAAVRVREDTWCGIHAVVDRPDKCCQISSHTRPLLVRLSAAADSERPCLSLRPRSPATNIQSTRDVYTSHNSKQCSFQADA